jgi:uncharacterized membrane protein YecN with MAPEG domain
MNVIKVRRKYKISVGDGGNTELEVAMSAHSNAIESIPIALILLFALEFNSASILLVHFMGIIFMLGRIIHARNLLADNLNGRVLGMKITIYSILVLAVLNIFFIPYDKLIG